MMNSKRVRPRMQPTADANLAIQLARVRAEQQRKRSLGIEFDSSDSVFPYHAYQPAEQPYEPKRRWLTPVTIVPIVLIIEILFVVVSRLVL